VSDIVRAAEYIRSQRNKKQLASIYSQVVGDSTVSFDSSVDVFSEVECIEKPKIDIDLSVVKNKTVNESSYASNDVAVGPRNSAARRFTTTDYYNSELTTGSDSNSELTTDSDSEREKSSELPVFDDKNISNRSKKLNLPLEKLSKLGFITPSHGKSLLTEEYRRIKRPILKIVNKGERKARASNVIVVSSSVSGEGKTFTALNLAMSLALERNKTVLLIDADVIKASVSKLLQIPDSQPGLTDLLSGNITEPSEVILRTNVPSLSCVRYSDRIILLDCPPILQTNEANIIADYADQVVFVVAEESTSQSYVEEALSQIDENIFVGIVLNKSRNRLTGSGYAYSYSYR